MSRSSIAWETNSRCQPDTTTSPTRPIDFPRKWTDEERRNSLKLEAVMKKHKFIPFPFEWWHFDYTGWENYPPLDISFESLGRGVRTAVPAR